jgi:hypothetical protein
MESAVAVQAKAWAWVLEVRTYLVDFLDQFLHAAKRSATNGPLRNAVEPNLHLIQPRGIGRSEMHMEARPCCEPTFYPRMLVRPVVIHDHVDVQLCWHVVLNLSQEIQIFPDADGAAGTA